MYPPWEKSNHGELHRIAKKYGKVYQSSIVCKPPTPMKRKAVDVIDLLPLKHRNLAVKATPKPPKSPSRRRPKQKVKCVPQRVKFEEHQDGHDSEGYGDSEEFADVSSEDHSDSHSPREANDEATPMVAPLVSKELEYISLGTLSDDEALHVVRHPKPSKHVIQYDATCNLTRKEVEERAWRKAKLKFLDGNLGNILSPLVPVEINGIYILITEASIQWMPKELVEDPQSCIDHLYKMLEDGIIGEKIGNAFGQWYLYGNPVRSTYVDLCHLFLYSILVTDGLY